MGINTINFAPGAEAVIPNTATNLKMIPSHPHNWVLEIGAETGVFGLLALLGTIAITFIHIIRAYLRERDNSYLIALCIFVGYWASGLFNFSFWSAWWQMSFVLIIALFLSQSSFPRLKSDKNSYD
jgi:O-antigen ligase